MAISTPGYVLSLTPPQPQSHAPPEPNPRWPLVGLTERLVFTSRFHACGPGAFFDDSILSAALVRRIDTKPRTVFLPARRFHNLGERGALRPFHHRDHFSFSVRAL